MEDLGALVLATLFLLGSPGPAPLSLAAAGATSGVRASLRFLAGILAGITVCIVAAAYGIAAILEIHPTAALVVQTIGAVYLLWIAYRIATAPVLGGTDTNRGKSVLGFRDGFLINLFNPKAYAAFLALFSHFLLPMDSITSSYITTGLVCFILVVIIDVAWLYAGTGMRTLFADPRYFRALRMAFAAAIVVATAIAIASIQWDSF